MKKLIYFTLGNNEKYINLAKICIDSLYKTDYNGDLLFITDMKSQILKKIKFKSDPIFLEIENTNIFGSSANKIKIYKFEQIYKYDKIIFSDLDIIWNKSPDIVFNEILSDKFYVSNENYLMSGEWWGNRLLNIEEKQFIENNDIKGINAGVFAFNTNMIKHFELMDLFLQQNLHLSNECLEQPFFNVYLFRNKLYDNSLNKHVSHDGYNTNICDKTLLHFCGGPGNFNIKYEKMKNYYNKNMVDTRDELLDIFNKNLVICEIGIFKGDFSKNILEKLNPKELHLIDLFEGMMCSGDKDGENIVWADLDEEYKRITNMYINHENIFIHKGKSVDILSKFADKYFDIIYIDGDHSYEGVKNDLEISFKKIKNNGFICGHDYISSKFEGVVLAVDEFCNDKNLKINYLTKDGCPSFCIIKNG